MLFGGDSGHFSLNHFIGYCETAYHTIHNINENCSVLGPSISYPLRNQWPDSITRHNSGKYTSHWTDTFNSSYTFWDSLDDAGLLLHYLYLLLNHNNYHRDK